MLNKFYNKIVLTVIALCLVIITIYIINSGFFKKTLTGNLFLIQKTMFISLEMRGKRFAQPILVPAA